MTLVRKEEHRNELFTLGADVVLNGKAADLEKQILSIIPNRANAALDAAGGSLGTLMFIIAAAFSRIIIYGRLSNDATSFSYGTLIYKDLKVEGFGIDNWLNTKNDNELSGIWKELTMAILNHTLQVSHDAVFELKDFAAAIKHYIETGNKVILK